MTSNQSEKYHGIIPPVVTPLLDQNTLDHEGLERLIDHILAGGVHGLFILGTTGEGPGLSYNLRAEITEKVCAQVDGSVPVLVGITDTSVTESIRLAEKASDAGADSVVAAPPYYFAANQPELLNYFRTLADQSPLPLFLYNMPSHTKVNFAPETVQELAKNPNIIGFKDSSGDVIYFQKVLSLLKDNPDFTVLVGPEEILMQTMLSGGHGGVNGGANMFPTVYVDMYNAAKEKDFNRMQQLQKKILAISSGLYTVGNSPMKYLQGVKCALSLMGICSDTFALPFHAFEGQEKEKIREALKQLDLGEVIQ
ncbi:dihydrodipicolinate synthase family protein [Rhodohalobacter sp. 614A]|uniref:dihydrodipicolinate synthase family protein n=1 Tax=Rhodohalobacter sp. 614A TaxID=2908649 RepID=UPI001F446AFA|nr:dihydrodipicolinate synthase family protein [Rhodohalobacter sp. 614A]